PVVTRSRVDAHPRSLRVPAPGAAPRRDPPPAPTLADPTRPSQPLDPGPPGKYGEPATPSGARHVRGPSPGEAGRSPALTRNRRSGAPAPGEPEHLGWAVRLLPSRNAGRSPGRRAPLGRGGAGSVTDPQEEGTVLATPRRPRPARS